MKPSFGLICKLTLDIMLMFLQVISAYFVIQNNKDFSQELVQSKVQEKQHTSFSEQTQTSKSTVKNSRTEKRNDP